jgi:hypothetical protein
MYTHVKRATTLALVTSLSDICSLGWTGFMVKRLKSLNGRLVRRLRLCHLCICVASLASYIIVLGGCLETGGVASREGLKTGGYLGWVCFILIPLASYKIGGIILRLCLLSESSESVYW